MLSYVKIVYLHWVRYLVVRCLSLSTTTMIALSPFVFFVIVVVAFCAGMIIYYLANPPSAAEPPEPSAEELAKARLAMLEEVEKERQQLLASHQRYLTYLTSNALNDVRARWLLWRDKVRVEKERASTIAQSMVEEAKQQLVALQQQHNETELQQARLREAVVAMEAQLVSHQATLAALSLEEARERDKANEGYLSISEADRRSIVELYGLVGKLPNPTPLYKAVYELFYRNPLRELVAKAGVADVCGIYSITARDGRRYVGQSVNVGERWNAHLRRGTGCEVGTLAGGKLYKALYEEGPWNFRWELVEACERSELTTKEQYYIGCWATDRVGLNARK